MADTRLSARIPIIRNRTQRRGDAEPQRRTKTSDPTRKSGSKDYLYRSAFEIDKRVRWRSANTQWDQSGRRVRTLGKSLRLCVSAVKIDLSIERALGLTPQAIHLPRLRRSRGSSPSRSVVSSRASVASRGICGENSSAVQPRSHRSLRSDPPVGPLSG